MNNSRTMTSATPRVWIVDDDEAFRRILELALRRHGATAHSFECAEHALEAFRTDKPDVLMTDIRMPGLSGLALLKKVRLIDPVLPVVVMTAHSDLGSAIEAFGSGAFEYLLKPFELDPTVRVVLRAAR